MNQALLLDTLKAIVTVAKTENNDMTQEQVKQYIMDSGLELDEEKYTFIYQYLGENGITVQGFDFKPIKEKEDTEEQSTMTDNEQNHSIENMENRYVERRQVPEEDSIYLNMYLSDLRNLPILSENEKLALWTEIRKGNESAKIQFMNGYFHEVVTIAKEYRNKGANLEDLIQEGNMALLQSFDSVKELVTIEQVDEYLKDSIIEGIERFIDEEVNDSDWENTMLAKINLIHEAAEHLAKELGHTATVKELSEYTKMTEEEIEDVKRLSKDVM